MRRALWVIFPCLLLIACAGVMDRPSPDAVQFDQRWMGQPEAKIIAALGPPTRETSDAKGGHILVWEFPRTSPRFCFGGCPPGTEPDRWSAVRHAYIGVDGAVYKTYWSGR